MKATAAAAPCALRPAGGGTQESQAARRSSQHIHAPCLRCARIHRAVASGETSGYWECVGKARQSSNCNGHRVMSMFTHAARWQCIRYMGTLFNTCRNKKRCYAALVDDEGCKRHVGVSLDALGDCCIQGLQLPHSLTCITPSAQLHLTSNYTLRVPAAGDG